MKFLPQFLVGIAICATWAVASAAVAQQSKPSLRLTHYDAVAPLERLDTNAAFGCPPPMRPAKVDVVFDLDTFGGAVTPFLREQVNTNRVVVRRGGQIETDADKRDNLARFDKKHITQDQADALTDLKLRTLFYFCEFAEFPEFVGLVYTLSGEFGNFTVHQRDSVTATSDNPPRLTYSGPPRSYIIDTQPPSIVGVLDLDLSLRDVPFQLKGGSGQLLGDLNASVRVEMPKREVGR